jgi:hypothetical protein
VANQNKGRGQGRAGVILVNQAVALETPILVSVLLNDLIGVAGKRRDCHQTTYKAAAKNLTVENMAK